MYEDASLAAGPCYTDICYRSFAIGSTGIFVLENDKAIFRTHTPHRTNYRSEWAQILHGCSFWQSIWGYRGVFRNSAQEPRYGVPLGGPPRGPKISKNFFLQNFNFLAEMVPTKFVLIELSITNFHYLLL